MQNYYIVKGESNLYIQKINVDLAKWTNNKDY